MLFWIGIIVGAILIGLGLWLRSKGISLTWYEWLLAVIGALFLVFTFENFFGSFAELEDTAAWMFLLVTGLPGLILLGVAYGLILRRQRTA